MPFVFIAMNGLHFPGLKKERKKERSMNNFSFLALALLQVSIKVIEVKFINLFYQFIEGKFINEINSLFG